MNSLKHNNWKLYSTSHSKGSWSTLQSYQTNSTIVSQQPNFSYLQLEIWLCTGS